jgi:hypothetical protein
MVAAMTKNQSRTKISATMSLPQPHLVARPDDDDREAPPPPPVRAREVVLNDPELLQDILAFVPVDSFRFVAPVNRIFRREYLAVHDNSTRTLLLHAAATPRTAQLWLRDGRPVMPLAVMAARWGRLDVLRYLHDDGWLWPLLTRDRDGHVICMAALSGGHLHVWEWMLTNQLAVWSDRMSNVAAQNGYLQVLQFARDRDYPISRLLLYPCTVNGRLNVVIWLHEQGHALHADDCSNAAQYGHLHILEWLRAKECHGDTETCAAAATGGHLHILQWLRANGCPWGPRTCEAAAEDGHLHILQWARANGCDWDERTCSTAARNGHIDIVQWARTNGCDWNNQTCFWAARNGHLDILQWARAHGCPWDAEECFEAAREREHAEIVEWMIVTMNM